MFEPFYLFVSIMMGLVGIGALRYGKNTGSIRHIALGIGMMVVPYFLIEAKLLALTGGAMALFLFWP